LRTSYKYLYTTLDSGYLVGFVYAKERERNPIIIKVRSEHLINIKMCKMLPKFYIFYLVHLFIGTRLKLTFTSTFARVNSHVEK